MGPHANQTRTVGGQQKVSGVLPFTPLDLVDLLLDLKRLEIVELGLMRLELCVKLVFTALLLQEERKDGDEFSDRI